MPTKKKLKKMLKQDYYGNGVPIYKLPCEECFFCKMPGKKEDRFAVCKNPFIRQETFMSRSMVVQCPDADVPKNCRHYKLAVKNKKDILLIKKYIIKYYVNGFVAIPKKHVKWLKKRINNTDDIYLRALFNYYGYIKVIDKHVAEPFLFTNRDFCQDNNND